MLDGCCEDSQRWGGSSRKEAAPCSDSLLDHLAGDELRLCSVTGGQDHTLTKTV